MTLVLEMAVSVAGSSALSQSVDASAGLATTMPVGRRSVNCKPNTLTGLTLLSTVNVKTLVPPRGMALGPKLFVNPPVPMICETTSLVRLM